MDNKEYLMETDKMVDVTEQLKITAYVSNDAFFKEDILILKIEGKNEEFSPIGFNVGAAFSPKILKHLKYDKNNLI